MINCFQEEIRQTTKMRGEGEGRCIYSHPQRRLQQTSNSPSHANATTMSPEIIEDIRKRGVNRKARTAAKTVSGCRTSSNVNGRGTRLHGTIRGTETHSIRSNGHLQKRCTPRRATRGTTQTSEAVAHSCLRPSNVSAGWPNG